MFMHESNKGGAKSDSKKLMKLFALRGHEGSQGGTNMIQRRTYGSASEASRKFFILLLGKSCQDVIY